MTVGRAKRWFSIVVELYSWKMYPINLLLSLDDEDIKFGIIEIFGLLYIHSGNRELTVTDGLGEGTTPSPFFIPSAVSRWQSIQAGQ